MKRKKEDLSFLTLIIKYGDSWKEFEKSTNKAKEIKHLKKQEKIYMVD